MKRMFIPISILAGLLFLWYYADQNDYFKGNYRDLSKEQKAVFLWNADSPAAIYEVYQASFGDTAYAFPRKEANTVSIYRNIPIVGTLAHKTLSKEDTKAFLSFCNNPDNFAWGETTWSASEAEYIFKVFDKDDHLIGKLYVCLNGCNVVQARPFTPNMKFGQLSTVGEKSIKTLISKYL